MYVHKNRRDDRCRIPRERLTIRQMLRTDLCGQACYSSIDRNACELQNGRVCAAPKVVVPTNKRCKGLIHIKIALIMSTPFGNSYSNKNKRLFF